MKGLAHKSYDEEYVYGIVFDGICIYRDERRNRCLDPVSSAEGVGGRWGNGLGWIGDNLRPGRVLLLMVLRPLLRADDFDDDTAVQYRDFWGGEDRLHQDDTIQCRDELRVRLE